MSAYSTSAAFRICVSPPCLPVSFASYTRSSASSSITSRLSRRSDGDGRLLIGAVLFNVYFHAASPPSAPSYARGSGHGQAFLRKLCAQARKLLFFCGGPKARAQIGRLVLRTGRNVRRRSPWGKQAYPVCAGGAHAVQVTPPALAVKGLFPGMRLNAHGVLFRPQSWRIIGSAARKWLRRFHEGFPSLTACCRRPASPVAGGEGFCRCRPPQCLYQQAHGPRASILLYAVPHCC